jgi:predicted amidophosphoribosyltransferase
MLVEKMVYGLGFCENCGDEITEDENHLCEECEKKPDFKFKFCHKCGKPLSKDCLIMEYDPLSGAQPKRYKCSQCGYEYSL